MKSLQQQLTALQLENKAIKRHLKQLQTTMNRDEAQNLNRQDLFATTSAAIAGLERLERATSAPGERNSSARIPPLAERMPVQMDPRMNSQIHASQLNAQMNSQTADFQMHSQVNMQPNSQNLDAYYPPQHRQFSYPPTQQGTAEAGITQLYSMNNNITGHIIEQPHHGFPAPLVNPQVGMINEMMGQIMRQGPSQPRSLELSFVMGPSDSSIPDEGNSYHGLIRLIPLGSDLSTPRSIPVNPGVQSPQAVVSDPTTTPRRPIVNTQETLSQPLSVGSIPTASQPNKANNGVPQQPMLNMSLDLSEPAATLNFDPLPSNASSGSPRKAAAIPDQMDTDHPTPAEKPDLKLSATLTSDIDISQPTPTTSIELEDDIYSISDRTAAAADDSGSGTDSDSSEPAASTPTTWTDLMKLPSDFHRSDGPPTLRHPFDIPEADLNPSVRTAIVYDLPSDIRIGDVLQHVRAGPVNKAWLADTAMLGTGMTMHIEFRTVAGAKGFAQQIATECAAANLQQQAQLQQSRYAQANIRPSPSSQPPEQAASPTGKQQQMAGIPSLTIPPTVDPSIRPILDWRVRLANPSSGSVFLPRTPALPPALPVTRHLRLRHASSTAVEQTLYYMHLACLASHPAAPAAAREFFLSMAHPFAAVKSALGLLPYDRLTPQYESFVLPCEAVRIPFTGLTRGVSPVHALLEKVWTDGRGTTHLLCASTCTAQYVLYLLRCLQRKGLLFRHADIAWAWGGDPCDPEADADEWRDAPPRSCYLGFLDGLEMPKVYVRGSEVASARDAGVPMDEDHRAQPADWDELSLKEKLQWMAARKAFTEKKQQQVVDKNEPVLEGLGTAAHKEMGAPTTAVDEGAATLVELLME